MFTTNRAFIHSGFDMSTLYMLVNIGSFNAIVITISALPNFAIFVHFRSDFSLVLICKKLVMKHRYKHCSIFIFSMLPGNMTLVDINSFQIFTKNFTFIHSCLHMLTSNVFRYVAGFRTTIDTISALPWIFYFL